jgi:hypothetical protein
MGECLETSAEFGGLRNMLRQTHAIVDEVANLSKVSSFQDLFKSYTSVITSIKKINENQIPDIESPQASTGCTLGLGDVDMARRSLNRARAYDDALAKTTPAPR